MAGLTSTGFESKTLQEILAEIVADQRAALGPAINTEPDSLLGVLNGVVAAKLDELWQVAEAVYTAQHPDSASGAALDRLAALTGVSRLAATYSTVTVRCYGTDGTVLPAGRVVSVDPTGERFASLADATIGSVTTGYVDVAFQAEELGPTVANTGTLTEIETPVSGWTSADNLADADPGRAIETDAELRQRRADLLEVSGDATLEAVRADVLAVDDVQQARVFENVTEATVDGMPPHSIEVVVLGGNDVDIAAAIFASKAAGIDTAGSESAVVEDSTGVEHTINFSRPTEVVTDVQITIRLEPTADSATVQAAVKASLAAAFLDARIGGDDGRVYVSRLYRYAFVSGVLDVDVLQIRVTSGGSYTTDFLTVQPRELVILDSADVAVTVTP